MKNNHSLVKAPCNLPFLSDSEQTDSSARLVQEYRAILEQIVADSPKNACLSISADLRKHLSDIQAQVRALRIDSIHVDLPAIHHTKNWRLITTFSALFEQFDQKQKSSA